VGGVLGRLDPPTLILILIGGVLLLQVAPWRQRRRDEAQMGAGSAMPRSAPTAPFYGLDRSIRFALQVSLARGAARSRLLLDLGQSRSRAVILERLPGDYPSDDHSRCHSRFLGSCSA